MSYLLIKLNICSDLAIHQHPKTLTKKIWREQSDIIKILGHRFLRPFLAQEEHFWWAPLCTNTVTKAASGFPKLGLATINEL